MENKLMKNYLKQKITSILEQERLENNPNDITDALFDVIDDYFWNISRHRPYYRKERERFERIEEKLDKVLENHLRERCRFSEKSNESALQFITGVGRDERNKAINHLSEKLNGAKSLIICDPYFLKKSKESSSRETAIKFVSILPKSLKLLNLYVKPRIRDKEFANQLNSELRQRNIKILSYKTEDIHDRVWIKDYDEAFVVGTSFNGLGNKCAFILDLPREDKQEFLSSLDEISRKLPKSKSA